MRFLGVTALGQKLALRLRSPKRFALSGVLITAISLLTTALMLSLGGERSAAVSIGYLVASICGYFLHSLYSFRRQLEGTLPPFMPYLLVVGASAFLAFIGSLAIDFILDASRVSLLLSIAFPVLANYMLWRLFLYITCRPPAKI